jgi:hypothetical protein
MEMEMEMEMEIKLSTIRNIGDGAWCDGSKEYGLKDQANI